MTHDLLIIVHAVAGTVAFIAGVDLVRRWPEAHALHRVVRRLTRPPSLAVLDDALVAAASAGVRRALDDALARLKASGAAVATVDAPVELATVFAAHRIITFAERAALHGH